MKKKTTMLLMFLFLLTTLFVITACNRTSVYTLEYYAAEGGRIEGEVLQTVESGKSGTKVTAVADKGYEFVEWSDGVTTATRTDENIEENFSVTARFDIATYNLHYLTDGNGTIEGNAKQTAKYGENGTEVKAVPDEGYKFVKWSDGVTTAVRADKNIKGNISVEAKFEKITFTVRYIADENGTIEGKAKKTQIIKYGEAGTEVTAIPNEGYEFVEWSDGVTTAARTDKNVRENISVEAKFERIVCVVRYTTDGNGTINGKAEQAVNYGENAFEVTAMPKEGYEFVRWSDGMTSFRRKDKEVKKDIIVTAEFRKKVMSVNYMTSDGSLGLIVNAEENRPTTLLHYDVEYGEAAPVVIAVPNYDVYGEEEEEYAFLGWSDGVMTRERHDLCVTSSTWNVTAYFGYKIEYKVNGDVGGKIEGTAEQKILPDRMGETITAVADEGYVFAGWSDLSWEAERRDEVGHPTGSLPYGRNLEFIAYFEPVKKMFIYDYGIASGIPLASSKTIYRDNLEGLSFTRPTHIGYKFCGWYADKEYKTRVVSEDNVYMLGYYGFMLDTYKLYSKWEKKDEPEEKPVFKILVVFLNEINATLEPCRYDNFGPPRDVHYLMTSFEREYCSLAPILMSDYLNEWFRGEVVFEVDSYYMLESVGSESFNFVPGVSGAYEISKVRLLPSFIHSYHSLLSVFSVNDYDNYLTNGGIAGAASRKYGDIFIEKFFMGALINYIPLQDELNEIKTDPEEAADFVHTFLHEFVHTCEMMYPSGEIKDYHESVAHYISTVKYDRMEATRLYLLGEMTYEDGSVGGIPKDFWGGDKADEMLEIIW